MEVDVPCSHSHILGTYLLQEAYYGREVILADRDMVEQMSDELFAMRTQRT